MLAKIINARGPIHCFLFVERMQIHMNPHVNRPDGVQPSAHISGCCFVTRIKSWPWGQSLDFCCSREVLVNEVSVCFFIRIQYWILFPHCCDADKTKFHSLSQTCWFSFPSPL